MYQGFGEASLFSIEERWKVPQNGGSISLQNFVACLENYATPIQK
jgi:hypothetical protein